MDLKTIEWMRDRVNRADNVTAKLNMLKQLKLDVMQPDLAIALPNRFGAYSRVDVSVTDDMRQLLVAQIDKLIAEKQKELEEI